MIYFAQEEGSNHIKIGFSSGDDAETRRRALQTGNSRPLVILRTMPGDRQTESDLHRRFAASRVSGEWFLPVPDLLRLIQGADSLPSTPAGEGVAVCQVSIKVLTVNRKQASLAFFNQIPTGDIIQWDAVYNTIEEGMHESFLMPVDKFETGTVWGLAVVSGNPWLLWEGNGVLKKMPLFKNESWGGVTYPLEGCFLHDRNKSERACSFWTRCRAKYKKLEQIFVGV